VLWQLLLGATDGPPRPAVAMAHGFSATIHFGLLEYPGEILERVAAAQADFLRRRI
jgi:hypothetical protein